MAVPSIALAQTAESCGGFTYNVKHGKHATSGFVVSVKGPKRIFNRPILLPADIDAFFQDNRGTFDAANIVFPEGACLGAWFNGATQRWYLDLSLVVKSLDEALKIARKNDQLAVFDLDSKQEIAVPYHAPPQSDGVPLTVLAE